MSDEAALRKAIQAALAEVYLTPDGAVDWQQTECADASRAMDVLAAAWHALAEPAPAVESICLRRAGRAVAPEIPPEIDQDAAADHRIAEAARVWAKARDSWAEWCEDCSDCDETEGPGCVPGLDKAQALDDAEAALIQALGGDVVPDA